MEAPELEMGYGEGGRSLGVLLAARLLCGAQPEVVWWGESPFWKREAIAVSKVTGTESQSEQGMRRSCACS